MLNRICYFGCPKLDVKFKMPIQGCIVSKSFMFTSGTSTLLSQRKLRSLKWRNVDASTPDPWLPKPPQRLRPNQRQKLTRRQRERPRCALNIFFFGKFSFPATVRILHEYFITNHKAPKKWSWHHPNATGQEGGGACRGGEEQGPTAWPYRIRCQGREWGCYRRCT